MIDAVEKKVLTICVIIKILAEKGHLEQEKDAILAQTDKLLDAYSPIVMTKEEADIGTAKLMDSINNNIISMGIDKVLCFTFLTAIDLAKSFKKCTKGSKFKAWDDLLVYFQNNKFIQEKVNYKF